MLTRSFWLAALALVACREAPSVAPPSPTARPTSAGTVHEPTDADREASVDAGARRPAMDMMSKGVAGVVHLLDDDPSGLRIRMIKGGQEVEARIFDPTEEPLDPTRVRFVDVDHDGLPDVVLDRGPKVASAPARFFVYLTHQVDFRSKDQPDIETDVGSQFYLLHVENIDAAVAALEGVPHRGMTESQACALIDSPGFKKPGVYAIVPPYDFGVCPFDDPETVVSCHKKVRDGSGFLFPVMRCDSWRPFCEFTLNSGGREGTPIPPSERRYWFDWMPGSKGAAGLRMIASAGWQGLCHTAADAGTSP
jgi:hypothetical protein